MVESSINNKKVCEILLASDIVPAATKKCIEQLAVECGRLRELVETAYIEGYCDYQKVRPEHETLSVVRSWSDSKSRVERDGGN